MRVPKVGLIVLKIAVTTMLLWYLFVNIDLGSVVSQLRSMHSLWVAAAIAILMAQLLLTGVRWHLVGKLVAAEMALPQALRLMLIGQFFSQLLPSSVGGDAVRAWIASHEGIPLGRAVVGIFCDRVTGLVVVVLIVSMSLLLLPVGRGTDILAAGEFVKIVAAFTVIGLLVLLLLGAKVANRVRADCRIDESLLSFAHGDGHAMPFESDVFGHVLCYDTLHHMHDYPKVFSEFFRVLRGRGRGVFVEPGARHSTSPETMAFVEGQKMHDPTWIERDVVLEEIDQIVRDVGFKAGLTVVPTPHPLALQTYSVGEWTQFREGDTFHRLRLTDQLASQNYWDRVIFYVDKPE